MRLEVPCHHHCHRVELANLLWELGVGGDLGGSRLSGGGVVHLAAVARVLADALFGSVNLVELLFVAVAPVRAGPLEAVLVRAVDEVLCMGEGVVCESGAGEEEGRPCSSLYARA